MKKKISILFVCLGNICRSPLAQGIAEFYNKKYNLNLIIDSAGTGDWHIGEPPCENSIKVAKNNNIDISQYRARQIKLDDFNRFNFIIALDKSNIKNIKLLNKDKDILKLGNYGYNGEDVPDPYFFDGFDGFDKVYNMIDICILDFLQKESILCLEK